MNKLGDQYSNDFLHSINKNSINADYFTVTEKSETNHKVPQFKVNDRGRTTNYKRIFSKGYTVIWSRKKLYH